jgi:tetratricopeptide (TPR) repeat protein
VNRLRAATYIALLLSALPLSAQTDSLAEVGQLLMSGNPAEARTRILAMRDNAVAQKNTAAEAGSRLLLGMTDVTLGDAANGRNELQQAEDQYTAAGDFFGAWMSLFVRAKLETDEGRWDDAIAVHERAQAVLIKAADPSAPFTIDTLKILGAVFGAPTQMLESMAGQAQLFKPILLQFMTVIANDTYAHTLIDSGRDLAKAETLLAQAEAGSKLFGGFHDFDIGSHLGELRQRQWRLDEAREQYLKALQGAKALQGLIRAPEPRLEMKVYARLAELEVLAGRADEGLEWNQRALTTARAGRDKKKELEILGTRGELLQKAGRSDAALALFEDTLRMAVDDGDTGAQASLHSSIGTLHYFNGAYGTAAKHLERAVALYQTRQESLLESTAWIMLAEVYMMLGGTDTLAQAVENGRALAKRSGFKLAEVTIDLIAAFESVSNGPSKPEDFEAAIQAWQNVPDTQTLGVDNVPELLREVARIAKGGAASAPRTDYVRLPQMARWMPLMLQGRLELARNANAAARRTFTAALESVPGGDIRTGLLALIGVTYWREGNREEGLRFFKDAVKALNVSAADVKVEEHLADYLGSSRRVYFEMLVHLLAGEGKFEEAFAEAERARARAFLQLVGNHRLNAEQGADPRLVREAEALRTDLIERERQMKTAAPAVAQQIAEDIKHERERYATVMTRVKTSNPEYAALTTVEPLEIGAIRQEIPPGTTVVSYFVSFTNVHAWTIDRNETHYALLPISAPALSRIVCWADHFSPRRDTRGVALPGSCSQAATAEEAYDQLIAPLAKHIKNAKLILVPHHGLHYVPFAALRNKETGRDLIDDYTLTYAPSVSVLRFLRAKETPVTGSALILGDPASPLPGLQKLPGAKREATSIALALGATPHLGADARESLLFGLDGKVDLVHLAAHGIYDPDNPLFSRVALAPGDARDGSLTVDEILSSLDLSGVNLVVLSACRTAVGARSGGDDVVGLTRALLYAGTPGVLSTLWNIDDAASAGLMNEFYRRLATGEHAAEALRHAQLAVKKSEPFSNPKYWAAFTLHGDPQGTWKR